MQKSKMNFKLSVVNIVIVYYFWISSKLFPIALSESTKPCHISDELQTCFTNVSRFNISYAERFLMNRAGGKIDLKKLMLEYSTICPVQKSCDVDFDRKYLFSGDTSGSPGFKDCQACKCSRHCVEDGNCCPGSYFGYVPHECTNIFLYPKVKKVTYYTVGTCLDEFKTNSTLIRNCESEVLPCTSMESGLVYKNQYCAKCNSDSNCVDWRLDVDCTSEEIKNENFDSYAEFKAALDKFNCEIQFKPTIFTELSSTVCSLNENVKKLQIDRCNVTGLWRQYDADIDWACNNFIVPYKVFKNVFCYICNPSHGNLQSEHLIENCQVSKSNTYLFNISSACKSFPVSDRLRPFKNIYCYACTLGHELLKNSETDVTVLGKISEMNDRTSLRTKMYISLVFPYENNVFEVERFVRQSLKGSFKHVNKNAKEGATKKFNVSNINEITILFEAVCGNGQLCNYDKKPNESYYSNPVCRNCSCEQDCAEYESCCLDTILLKQPYTCLNSKEFPLLNKQDKGGIDSYFEIGKETFKYKVIDTCLNESHELSGKCSLSGDTNDYFAFIPIHAYGNIAYRNIYCYKCNNKLMKPIFLDFQAHCRTFIEYNLFTNLTQFLNTLMIHCQTVSFLPLKTKTCVPKYDAQSTSYIGGEHFQRVEEHPNTLDEVVFQKVFVSRINDKVKDVFSSCNISGYQIELNHVVKNMCESNSPTILSLPEYRLDRKVYKNFACFLCNPEFYFPNISSELVTSDCAVNNSVEWYEENTVLRELCENTPQNDRWFPFKNMYCAECNLPPWQLVKVLVAIIYKPSLPFYKYIFSLSPEDFNKMDEASSDDGVVECLNGTYDYILKQCRPLYCNEGSQLYQLTCKPLFETAYNHLYIMHVNLYVKELDGSRIDERNGTFIELEQFCVNISQRITEQFDETTEFLIQELVCTPSPPCLTPALTDKFKYVDIAVTDLISFSLTIYIQHTESVSHIRTVLINATSLHDDVQDLSDIDANKHSVLLEPDNTYADDPINPDPGCPTVKFTFKEIDGVKTYNVNKFLQCAYVKFDKSETIISNDTLTVSVHGKKVSFSKNEYVFKNENVIICINDFNDKINNFDDENVSHSDDVYVNALNMFTQFCTIISLVCLFLTFITYCFFSSLRTIPGKGVMLLCFSLFLAQASLQFGLNDSSKSIVCVIIGIAIHYFWIALFTAMNISSFHMFRVFYMGNLSNQVTQNKKCLFIKYLLYFTLLPLILILVAVSVSLFQSDMTSVGYGFNYCFISDFYIFVGTFLTPVCLICLSNFIFFSLAFHKIRSTPDVQSNQDKNYFYIFLKLSILVGITWPLLIVDNILGVSWFSFVASGINSLQGMFVFISFILNKKIIYLYKSKFVKSADNNVPRNGRSTTCSIINKTRV